MSETRITVEELISKLSEYPPDMLAAVIYPGHADMGETEGQLDGPKHFEVRKCTLARSGYHYPPDPSHIDDDFLEHEVLVISDVGVQWLE
jgi:hypothetical protein